MAQLANAVIKLEADTEQFKRDVARAQRRIQWHTFLLPLLVGFLLALVAGTVGFILGLSA